MQQKEQSKKERWTREQMQDRAIPYNLSELNINEPKKAEAALQGYNDKWTKELNEEFTVAQKSTKESERLSTKEAWIETQMKTRAMPKGRPSMNTGKESEAALKRYFDSWKKELGKEFDNLKNTYVTVPTCSNSR